MGPRLLTVDLGNSRCKLVVWSDSAEGGERTPARESRVALAGDGLVERLGEWLGRQEDLGRVALSSVAAEHLEHAVTELLTRRGLEVLALGEPLENRTLEPDAVGRDRLFAARGAFQLLGRSTLVVDAGTALTVDAVVGTEPEGEPPAAFLGGAIAPGAALGARALAQGAARLPQVEPRPGVPALGRDTQEAIRSGLVVGLRGAANELVERIAAETGLEDAPVVLTGGAAPLLLEPRPFTRRSLSVEEDLVHLGLVAAAGALSERA